MSLINNDFLWGTLGVIVALFVIFYTYALWAFQFWKRRNVPFVPPKFPCGNMQSPFNPKNNFGEVIKSLYDEFRKKDLKFGGIYLFLKPLIIAVDPELVKNVMIKDFDHFVDRGNYCNEKDDPLSAHLFNLDGAKWADLRRKLSPTFTSGKMKLMFDTLLSCTPYLVKKMESNLSKPLKIKDILECFTTDVIGSCAFGLECKSFEDNDSPFRTYGKKIFENDGLTRLKLFFAFNYKKLADFLGVRFTKKDVEEFFINLVKDTVEYRKTNNVQRNDFLQLIINQDNMSLNEMAAQSLLFFAAGFETSATTMSFALYNLSKNPEIQERVRSEIEHVLKKHNGKISYEAIFEMKYLGQVIDETLRMFPPVPNLTRSCIKDYKVPDSDLVIKEGEIVMIPVLGIHYDKDLYPNPEKFNPDRFEEDKNPYIFLPFGAGPRNCIGLRFGLMQTRVGLVTLLTKYKFTINSQTREPIEMDPELFILWIKGDLWLNAEKV